MRTAILMCGIALVAWGCSATESPTAPISRKPVKVGHLEWICPAENGFVIHTGNTPPYEGCQLYSGQ